MNTSKVAAALNTISVAFGELAEALNEQPEIPPSGVGSAGRAAPETGSPPATFSDGLPVEEPPLFPDSFETFTTTVTAPLSQNVTYTTPAPTEQDRILSECPVHFTAWTIKEGGMSRNGKPYSAFWRCVGKNDDGSYCAKKPDKGWLRTHDPEKALVA